MQIKMKGITSTRVLMVCLGNICRSPLAEGILIKLLQEQGLEGIIEVDSAGTAGHTAGSPPDHRSIEVARMNGINLSHRARQLRRGDFKNFDHILVMDESNLRNVLNLAVSEDERNKVQIITKFDSRPHKLKIVADPYWGEINDFIHTYEQLLHCCKGWISFYREAESA